MQRMSHLAHRAFDGALDLRYGISTWGTADDEFHPTSYRLLHRMFQRLGVTRDDVLIDLGCGFGRAVCVGAQYPFRRIRGVELDPASIERARRNVARLRTRLVADIRVDRADATEYDCADATIVYMFNPFNGETFARVLARIRSTMRAREQGLRLVYLNPVERHQIESCGWLELVDVIYHSRAGVPSILLYRSR